jgi:hypothetical protein
MHGERDEDEFVLSFFLFKRKGTSWPVGLWFGRVAGLLLQATAGLLRPVQVITSLLSFSFLLFYFLVCIFYLILVCISLLFCRILNV